MGGRIKSEAVGASPRNTHVFSRERFRSAMIID
jgi:hypothetical protein